MGKHKLLEQHFEFPVYCTKWLSDGEHCIIGGGGGRSSDLPNRLVCWQNKINLLLFEYLFNYLIISIV